MRPNMERRRSVTVSQPCLFVIQYYFCVCSPQINELKVKCTLRDKIYVSSQLLSLCSWPPNWAQRPKDRYVTGFFRTAGFGTTTIQSLKTQSQPRPLKATSSKLRTVKVIKLPTGWSRFFCNNLSAVLDSGSSEKNHIQKISHEDFGWPKNWILFRPFRENNNNNAVRPTAVG